MTLALARKWRPKNFDEMVGQEHVVRALTNALTQNRLHHAYLMTGTRGVGKTTLARVLAKALNCETGVSASPCGRCAACTEIDGGRFVDLIELDAASNTQVDQMRELLENALYAPTRARFKVYIIDEVHMLSRSAFNAMLKTLEEPPQHVKFILATTDPQKVPVTVLSRCLQFNLRQIPLAQIREQLARVLEREGIAFDGPALNLIARAAHGSMRDGLSLLDQAIAHGGGRVDEASVRTMLGTVDREYLFSILEALAAADGPALIGLADDMQARSLSFEAALQDLAALLHRLALAQRWPETLSSDDPDRERILALAARFAPEDLQLDYQIALQGRDDIDLAPDEYAGFTMALLRMLAFVPEGEGRAERPSTSAVSASTAPAAAGPAPAGAASTIPDWRELVARLKLGGMARMLAQHSEIARLEGDRLELRVPEAHKHLLDKPYRDKLQAALEEHLGRRLKVDFALGQAAGMTPAEQEDRERQARLQQAVQAIDGDPFVRDLVENFDARVVDESIRPVD
ncbi:MAG TPA: DNA polymerase III subunit gamma/tau [Burkholderiales bacterium]|nr:DNA polymerase III subunit gamma/tau [Burkholderiales bacterium]